MTDPTVAGPGDAREPELIDGTEAGAGPEHAAPGAEPALVAAVAALRDRLSLTNIRMQRLLAEALMDPPWTPDTIHLSSQPPEFKLEQDSLACRFEQTVELLDGDREPLARASACAVVEFDLGPASTADGNQDADGDELSARALELFVDQNGYFIAYPYLRQAIHDLTARLGFDAVVLGVLPRGQQRPSHLALVRPQSPGVCGEPDPVGDGQ